jgi:hypothetical protein
MVSLDLEDRCIQWQCLATNEALAILLPRPREREDSTIDLLTNAFFDNPDVDYLSNGCAALPIVFQPDTSACTTLSTS